MATRPRSRADAAGLSRTASPGGALSGRRAAGTCLQTTALVNEAYLRLIDWKNVQWQNRAHFFGVSAQTDAAHPGGFRPRRECAKRGGGAAAGVIVGGSGGPAEQSVDLVALDDALIRWRRWMRARAAGRIALLRRAEHGGNGGSAEVSLGTVRRDWSLAQAWLYRELSRRERDEG